MVLDFGIVPKNSGRLESLKRPFLFHQKFPLLDYDLKNVLTKHFPKMQKQPFADVPQNGCSLRFRDIHKKISVLESLSNTVTGLKVCNFIKKRPLHSCFPVNITEFLITASLKEHPRWLLLKMVEEFIDIL